MNEIEKLEKLEKIILYLREKKKANLKEIKKVVRSNFDVTKALVFYLQNMGLIRAEKIGKNWVITINEFF